MFYRDFFIYKKTTMNNLIYLKEKQNQHHINEVF